MGAIPGVVEVMSGYTGGRTPIRPTRTTPATMKPCACASTPRASPTANWSIATGATPIQPTLSGQFCDRGSSYRPAIFVTPAQRADAEASKAAVIASGRVNGRVITPVLDLGPFTEAEEYHRDYARRNAMQYQLYRTGCGRDARLREVWRR